MRRLSPSDRSRRSRGAALDAADSGDHSRGRRLAVVAVIGDQETDFEKQGSRIDQLRDALARSKLAFAVLLFDFLRAAAGSEFIFESSNPAISARI